MNKVVLDSSAILALLNKEPGFNVVEEHLSRSMVSTVNVSEVISVLMGIGMSEEEAENLTTGIFTEVINFDHQQAHVAGFLRKKTKSLGLSLGDRACLALAKVKKLPTITADTAWKKLNETTEIIFIR